MNTLEQQVWNLIDAGVQEMSLRLVRIRLMGGEHNPTLQIMIEPTEATVDHPVSVTLEECENVSRMASALMDVEDLIENRYQLEVSSTGVERPFVTKEDFQKFVGARAKMKLVTPIDGVFKFTGILKGMSGEDIMLQDEATGVETRIAFDNMRSAHRVFNAEELDQMMKG